jgi:hypothetical protein
VIVAHLLRHSTIRIADIATRTIWLPCLNLIEYDQNKQHYDEPFEAFNEIHRVRSDRHSTSPRFHRARKNA